MKITGWDRFLMSLAPRWGTERVKARALAERLVNVSMTGARTTGLSERHFEAAAQGRRTSGWAAQSTYLDADLSLGLALIQLRAHARDLVRNNGWARRGQRIVANNTVGWGIVPKSSSRPAQALWNEWAGSTSCCADGRKTFAAIQHQVMRAIFESGEVLIHRRVKNDGRAIPLELRVLESDYLDHTKLLLVSDSGGPIIRGVEFDKEGKRAGYWLFENHPGSGRNARPSSFVPAADVLHIYEEERPGQTRGISWCAAAIVPLKDLGDLEDAELVKQKIAACFTAFVTDVGPGDAVGEQAADPLVENFEPGMIAQLPPGKTVEFGVPPTATLDNLPSRTLRRVAAAWGVTYEDLSNDYSQVNFSSGRMGRLSHYANVRHWQHNLVIPLLCQPVWRWAMEAAELAGSLDARAKVHPTATWTPPPMPMLEPDKEGLAYSRLVRNGLMSQSEAIREQGYDPEDQFAEIAADNAKIDALGLVFDSDPRTTTAAGQAQVTPEEAPAPGSGSEPAP